MTHHDPIAREKPADGLTLHRLDCSCGHQGLAWYAGEAKAWTVWERHLPAEVVA